MKSIRQRLFLQIAIVILITLGLIWFANAFLLESYYIKQQKNTLLDNYHTLNALTNDELISSLDTFLTIEAGSNVDIILSNTEDELVYTTGNYYSNDFLMKRIADSENNQDTLPLRPRMAMGQNPPMPHAKTNDKLIQASPNHEIIQDGLFYAIGKDPINNGQTLALIGQMDNGYYINLRTPLASVNASVNVVNRFLVLIGIVIMGIAMVITYIFSNFFTKPIKEISRVTGHMKLLDFSEQCNVHAQDELGALAANVNEMSITLSQTIDHLHDANVHLTEEIDAKNVLDHKRRQLLNNVSHELKTPLSLMEGYAEALQIGLHKDPDKVNFYCEVIMDETQKMNALVQGLLNIDQMEFGDVRSHPENLNLTDYINNTIEKFMPQINKEHLELSMSVEEGITVRADPLRLEQVFTNYITNAIHYCDDNKSIQVTLSTNDAMAIIEIHNSAPKLSTKHLTDIWDSFFKVDKARTRENGGHGLGLSIVKAIQTSDRLGYGVKNEGDGVTFWFEQPLAISREKMTPDTKA